MVDLYFFGEPTGFYDGKWIYVKLVLLSKER